MAMAIASNLNYVTENNYLEMVVLLTFLVGLFQIMAGLFRLGKSVKYVSYPVIIGLTSGAAFIIGIGRIKNLIGIDFGHTKVVLIMYLLNFTN